MEETTFMADPMRLMIAALVGIMKLREKLESLKLIRE